MEDNVNVLDRAYVNHSWEDGTDLDWSLDTDWEWHYAFDWDVSTAEQLGVAETHIPDSPYYKNWYANQNWLTNNNWFNSDAWIWYLDLDEQIGVGDSLTIPSRIWNVDIKENLGFAERVTSPLSQILQLNLEEKVLVAETHVPDSPYSQNWLTLKNWRYDSNWLWGDAWPWTLDIEERLAIQEAHANDYRHAFRVDANETLGVWESHIPDRPYQYNWRTLKDWHTDSNWYWADAWLWSYYADTDIHFDENAAKNATKQLRDAFGFNEHVAKTVGRNAYESFIVSDSKIEKDLSFHLAEKLAFKETPSKTPTKELTDGFGIRDQAPVKYIEHVPQERLTTSDVIRFDGTLEIHESVSVKDKALKTPMKEIPYEAFGVRDSAPVKYVECAPMERLNVADVMDRQITFKRVYDEAFRFNEAQNSLIGLNKYEEYRLYDAILRPVNGVVSDILFQQGGWDTASVREMMLKGKHVGYERFKTFLCGDYEYDKALFRTTISAESSDRAVLEQFRISVDVPDLVDRGADEVLYKTRDKQINFNKSYHVAPEVTITMRSGVAGEPIVPVVVTVNEKFFTMYLMNAITGERTTGTFVWSAVGY